MPPFIASGSSAVEPFAIVRGLNAPAFGRSQSGGGDCCRPYRYSREEVGIPDPLSSGAVGGLFRDCWKVVATHAEVGQFTLV